MEQESSKADLNQLKEVAHMNMLKAYAPYSKFLVGAAILGDDKRIYGGCNVENAAYPEGMCAEASAISAMIAGGVTIIEKICVISQSEKIVSPCGGCRQKIREFSTEDTKVFLFNLRGSFKVFSVEELLPFSFSEFDDLAKH
ncbi:MAG: cytidine deaminase [Rhodobacteraceae bacterium]|nr:MAG: cytidine deaminase [Paracoccaceae bacterium]|tara:strand:- start:1441 stop:1866 length:426 start_codon:yes stop_codon:yes gene_type:complete